MIGGCCGGKEWVVMGTGWVDRIPGKRLGLTVDPQSPISFLGGHGMKKCEDRWSKAAVFNHIGVL